MLIEECEAQTVVEWHCQADALRQAQECYGQGPFLGDSAGHSPTCRGKASSKPNLMIDGSGEPLNVVVVVVNVQDTQLLVKTLARASVECTLAWLSKCPVVLMRYDKRAFNYIGQTQLTGALFWRRRQSQLKP